MGPLRVHAATSYLSVYLLLGFSAMAWAVAWISGEMDPAKLVSASTLGGIGLVAAWAKAVQGRHWVEIDASLEKVVVHRATLFFRSRTVHYPLGAFGAVRSYITVGRYPTNLVELVTRTGGEALEVMSRTPTNGARSFWSVPHDTESDEAADLRQQIATYAGLQDEGFLGVRMIGAQLKDGR